MKSEGAWDVIFWLEPKEASTSIYNKWCETYGRPIPHRPLPHTDTGTPLTVDPSLSGPLRPGK